MHVPKNVKKRVTEHCIQPLSTETSGKLEAQQMLRKCDKQSLKDYILIMETTDW